MEKVGVLLGMAVICVVIWVIAEEKVEDKPRLMLVGYLTGAMMAVMLCCYCVKPKLDMLESRINKYEGLYGKIIEEGE